MKRFLVVIAALVLAAAACTSSPAPKPEMDPKAGQVEAARGLRAASEFASIADEGERSRAIFAEMAKVLLHPRCVNCHPSGDTPMQTDAMRRHQPLVVRGEGGFGAPGLQCDACHGAANFGNVPGNPVWHLAPASMAWEGEDAGAICEQLKDPARNGGRDLEAIIRHVEEDGLVGYGWNPPAHLEPAPGSQAELGELTRAWVEAGASCPE